MKKIISLCLVLLLVSGLASPALAQNPRVQWEWRDSVTTVHPSFSSSLDNGNILLVKNGYTGPAVVEINQAKEVVWEYGPIQANSAVRLKNGNTLITDSGAPGHPFKPQVIEINAEGKTLWSYDLKTRAQAPRYAERLSNGNTLIVTPTKVVEVSPGKEEVWSYSKELVYPVKAVPVSTGNILIVDKGLNGGKVVEVNKAGRIVWEYGNYTKGTNQGQLSGPVDAIRLEDGTTIIVDAGSSRIIYLNTDKKVTAITHWQDVMSDLPIMNLWGVNLASDQEIYLSLSYTNGRPALVKINDKSLKTYLNGQWLYTSVLPQTIGGTTMVPAKDFLTAFGAGISWDGQARKMTAEKDGVKLELYADTRNAVLNETEIELTVAPKIIGNTFMIPLRTATDTFGVGLKWDSANNIINLTLE